MSERRTTGKRGNGEGTIVLRKDGRWQAALVREDGRRKFIYTKTRDEAARELRRLLRERDQHVETSATDVTVASFLESWLESVRHSLRARTYQRYEELLRLHAMPQIGKMPLVRISALNIQRIYATCLEQGLSPTTVHHLHMVLHKAFRQACDWDLVGRNVVDRVSPPRIVTHEVHPLSIVEVHRLLESSRGDRFEALYVLAVSTGMREGELLALHWSDIDFNSSRLLVNGTLQRTKNGLEIHDPKTRKSRRSIALAAMASDALMAHEERQRCDQMMAGSKWEEHDLVFPNRRGKPQEAGDLLRQSFGPILARAGLPKMRFHNLRHTAATLMLGAGVHPKIASEILGHSTISITLDLYSHVSALMQESTANIMNRLLESGAIEIPASSANNSASREVQMRR